LLKKIVESFATMFYIFTSLIHAFNFDI